MYVRMIDHRRDGGKLGAAFRKTNHLVKQGRRRIDRRSDAEIQDLVMITGSLFQTQMMVVTTSSVLVFRVSTRMLSSK